MNYNKRLYEEVTREEAVSAIISRIEQQHSSKMKRICRSAKYEGNFHFTVILENYELLEVTLKAAALQMFDVPAIEVEIEVY